MYHTCTDKSKYSSPIPDFYSLKHECGVVAKEVRNVAMVNLLSFFLQIETNDDEELLLLKLTRAVAFLLVESDEAK